MVNKTLESLKKGESAIIEDLKTADGLRRRFRDLGLINGTEIKCTGQSKHKDISAYLVKGAVIAIRREDAKTVLIK